MFKNQYKLKPGFSSSKFHCYKLFQESIYILSYIYIIELSRGDITSDLNCFKGGGHKCSFTIEKSKLFLLLNSCNGFQIFLFILNPCFSSRMTVFNTVTIGILEIFSSFMKISWKWFYDMYLSVSVSLYFSFRLSLLSSGLFMLWNLV